jgi:hypothetical protein
MSCRREGLWRGRNARLIHAILNKKWSARFPEPRVVCSTTRNPDSSSRLKGMENNCSRPCFHPFGVKRGSLTGECRWPDGRLAHPLPCRAAMVCSLGDS